MTLPLSTYRFQFRDGVTFDHAIGLVPYLQTLGISHFYASPVFTAVQGSTHGYDVTHANEIDPALGGRSGFDRLVEALQQANIGLILDIVPNHMAASVENMWWYHVLEWGQDSPYAFYFDIDWRERLTLPQLDSSFDQALADHDLSLALDEIHGGLALAYFDHLFPLDPRSYPMVLERISGAVSDTIKTIAEKASPQSKTGLHRMLRDLVFENSTIDDFTRDLKELSRDQVFMKALHERQAWQLLCWKDAAHHLSYRRFFEITGLVGLRVEDPAVFDATHTLILELIESGQVQGLRLDHIDGLADPKAYLERLREKVGPDIYIVAEKILGPGEAFRQDWPISGTTGYEFITALSQLFTEKTGLDVLDKSYRAIAGDQADFDTGLRIAKSTMINWNFEGEKARLVMLAQQLSTETSKSQLADAISELLIAFPVYRTYGTAHHFPSQDQIMLDHVVAQAARHLPDNAALQLIADLLGGQRQEPQAQEFRSRFQQLSGPAMAKAMEDTLFYRYNRLLAANEVGGEPYIMPGGIGEFHALMSERLHQQPHGLSASSTHDTKRGEDARARLYTITENAPRWCEALKRWRGLNAQYLSRLPDGPAPGSNVEWMLYQALLGIWPENFRALQNKDIDDLRERFVAYAEKAVREAKTRTDWNQQNADYEKAVKTYAGALLSSDNKAFLDDFDHTVQPFITAGQINSLAQTLIKLVAPGIPDIYQGAEGFDLSLVDPDNRRAVAYDTLKTWLKDEARPFTDLMPAAMKQRVIQKSLHIRQMHPDIFTQGDYVSLTVEGEQHHHVMAFARQYGGLFAIAITPRFMLSHIKTGGLSADAGFWADTRIVLPAGLQPAKHDALTGQTFQPNAELLLRDILVDQPVALLISS